MEVDYLTDLGGPLAIGQNPFAWIRSNPNDSSAPFHMRTTVEDWVTQVRAPYLLGPTEHLHNPDEPNTPEHPHHQDGVEVHLDLGVAPLNALDEARFGDWPSASSRGVVEDWILEFEGSFSGAISIEINGHWRTLTATNMLSDEVAASIGILVLGIAADEGEDVTVKDFYAGDGGGETASLKIATTQAGEHFTRDILPFVAPTAEVRVLGEADWSLRDHRFDTLNSDATRRGISRYAVVVGLGGGGRAQNAAFITGIAPLASFAHELGHTVGISHKGHAQWENVATDCIPHYDSLMRYSKNGGTFLATDSPVSLNAARTEETATFGWSFNYNTFTQSRGTTAPASSTPGTALTSWWLRKTTARSGAKQPRGSWRPEGRR